VRALGIVLIAVATMWPVRPRWARLAVGAAGGAAIVWSTWDLSLSEPSRAWAAVGTVVLAALVAVGAEPLQGRLATPAVPWLVFGAAAVAIYGCVPETGQMAEVGVLLACGGVAELARRQALPAAFVAAGGGVVLWSGVDGAVGRQSALVGALFAVAATLWVPVAARVWRALGAATEPWRWVTVVVAAAASVGMARTGGLERTAGPALVAAGAWAVLVVAATWLLAVAAGWGAKSGTGAGA
jgi:hypothetical protein